MKVRIDVDDSELHKLSKYTIIAKEEIGLRCWIDHTTSYCDLPAYDIDLLIEGAKRAIGLGTDYGILVDIESRRDHRDERCYVLHSVDVVKSEDVDHTVLELLDYIQNC